MDDETEDYWTRPLPVYHCITRTVESRPIGRIWHKH